MRCAWTLPLLLLAACAKQPQLAPAAEVLPTPVMPEHGTLVAELNAELAFCQRQIMADPYNFIAYRMAAAKRASLARATGYEQQFVAAEIDLRESLRLQPKNNPEARGQLATVRMAFHDFHGAREICDLALLESPDETWLKAVRGDACFGLGEYESARDDYEEFHKAKPCFASLTRLAALSFVFGDAGHARALYEQAAENSTGIGREPAAWARLMVGVQDLKFERFADARAHFAASLRMAPDYFLAMEHIAETLEAEGRDEDARPYLETAIAIQRDPGLLDRLAAMNERAGRVEAASALRAEALAILEKRVADGGVGHLRALAESLMDCGQELPRALVLAERDIKIRRDLEACRTLARALRLNGRAKEAVPFVTEMLRYKTPDKSLWVEAEAVYEAAGVPLDWLRDNRPFA